MMLFLITGSQDAYAYLYNSIGYFKKDGLKSGVVHDMTQVADGTIWFATDAGPCQYTGVAWNTFSDSIIFPVGFGARIAGDRQGNLWLMGKRKKEYHIITYKDKKWQALSLPEEIKRGNLKKVRSDFGTINGEEKLALFTGEALYIYDVKSARWSNVAEEMYQGAGEILNVKFDNDRLFLLQEEAINLYNGQSIEDLLPDYSVFPGGKFVNIEETAAKDTLFVVGENWMGVYAHGKFSLVEELLEEESPQMLYYKCLIHQGDFLYYNAARKVRRLHLKTGEVEDIASEQFLYGSLNSRLLLDRESNLWVATHRGVFKFRDFQFRHLALSNEVERREVASFAELSDGQYFLGGNLYCSFVKNKEHTTFKTYPKSVAKGYRVLWAIDDREGGLFVIVNRMGLGRIRKGKRKIEWLQKEEDRDITHIRWHKDTLWAIGDTFLGIWENGRFLKKYKLPAKSFYSRKLEILNGERFFCDCSLGSR